MSRESIFNKIRKKVDKEYAEELRAEALAEKERKKQEAIAAYKTKRTLTVEKFFEAAGLKFPSSLGDIRPSKSFMSSAARSRPVPEKTLCFS